jgi:hypothetical protein
MTEDGRLQLPEPVSTAFGNAGREQGPYRHWDSHNLLSWESPIGRGSVTGDRWC